MDKNSNNDLQISIQKLKIVQGEHLKTVANSSALVLLHKCNRRANLVNTYVTEWWTRYLRTALVTIKTTLLSVFLYVAQM
jgi:hypothetical protein